MLTALIVAASILVPAYNLEPEPEPCRMCVCNDTYDVCIGDMMEDWEAGVIDGGQLLDRYQSCTEWLLECQRIARFLDAIDTTVPILPGSIEFPPGWDYED